MHSSTTTVPNCQSLKPTKKLFISESFETRPGWLTLPLEWNPGGAVPTPPKSPERGNQLLSWRWLSRLWWSRGLYDDDSDSDHDNNISGLVRPPFVLSLLPNSLSWSQWQVHIIHHLFYHQGFKALFSCFFFVVFCLHFLTKSLQCVHWPDSFAKSQFHLRREFSSNRKHGFSLFWRRAPANHNFYVF